MTDTRDHISAVQVNTPRGVTRQFPDLGTGFVSYESSVSAEFFEAEREAVFKRSWLKVGRVEQLPRVGSFFTRELPGLASIVLTRSARRGGRAAQRVLAPWEQGRVDRAPEGGVERLLP